MVPAEYGVFALVNSVLVLLTGVHTALILEPMSVLGSSHHRYRLDRYLRVVGGLNGRITLWAAASLLLAGLACFRLAAHRSLGMSLLGLVVALPCVFLFLVVRRFCYLEHRPEKTLAGSAVYATAMCAGVSLLDRVGAISPAATFLVMGLASCAAALLVTNGLSSGIASIQGGGRSEKRAVWREHWLYGRWILLASLAYWGSTEVYYTFTASQAGFEQTAELRALQNLIAPIMQAMAALGTLLLPWVASRRVPSGNFSIRAAARKITMIMTLGAIAYALVLLEFGDRIVAGIYGGRYADQVRLLPFIAFLPIATAIGSGWQISLRAAEQPWTILIGYATSAALTLSLGPMMVRQWGIEGSAAGLVISLSWYAAAVYYFGRRIGDNARPAVTSVGRLGDHVR
jgi:O-antigen/teichoic acid export membrane protein